MLILIIAGGPDKGRIYELLDGQEIVLGREGDQVKLNDRKVSREHARLWCEGNQWYIEDLGSRHGTHRNHQQLEKGAKAKLKDGDYIQVGSTVMVMGRMPAEHAERLAMLGQQSGAVPAWRKPGVMAGAGVAAAIAVLGVSGYLVYQIDIMHGQSAKQTTGYTDLQQALIDAQQQNVESNRRLEEAISARSRVEERLLNRLDNVSEDLQTHSDTVADATNGLRNLTDPMMERLEAIEQQAKSQELALERVSEMLAHEAQRDNSATVLAVLNELKTEFAGQPNGDELVQRLSAAIENNAEATGEAVRRVLAEHAAEDTQLAASARTEQLVMRVLEELESMPSSAQIAADVRAAIGDPYAGQERFMREVLAELRHTGEQIEASVASALNEDAGEAQRLMAQVLDELGQQPTGEQLASQLREAMDDAATGGDEANAQLVSLMQEVLSELEQRPTSEQLAADLREAVGADAQRTQQLMAEVLAELGTRPTAEQIAQEIRDTDDGSAQRTAEMMESILARIDEQNTLAGEVAQLRTLIEARPEGSEELIRAAMARIDEQSRNSVQLLHAIADLREAMPPDVSDQLSAVVAKLDEQVRSEQITETIEAAVQRIAAARDEDTLNAIESMQQRLNNLPSAAQLEEMLASQAQLASLLDESGNREALGELRAALERLAEVQPESTDQRLNQILDMLEEREEIDLMLAEMHDLMASQPEQAEQMRAELLEAIQQQAGGDTDRLLEELLAEVQQRMASDDTIRQAIREEIAGTVQPNRMALEDGRDIASNGSATPNPGSVNTDDPQPAPAAGSRLSDLERAYREAFETGKPVTVGAGVIDPTTGQVSEGRTLDPAVARALGYTTWRDWYLTDMHAERMRLQQQAQRDRNEAQSENPDDIVTLPGPGEE